MYVYVYIYICIYITLTDIYYITAGDVARRTGVQRPPSGAVSNILLSVSITFVTFTVLIYIYIYIHTYVCIYIYIYVLCVVFLIIRNNIYYVFFDNNRFPLFSVCVAVSASNIRLSVFRCRASTII